MTDFLSYLHIRLSGMDFLRLIGAGIAAVFTYIFGGADNWLVGLAVLVVADYISGVIAAYINHTLNSKRGFAGILKKILLFCVIAVANIIDNAISPENAFTMTFPPEACRLFRPSVRRAGTATYSWLTFGMI